MTDRIASFTVVLAKDTRDDDVDLYIVNAIRMVKGVIRVTPHVVSFADIIERSRVSHELEEQLVKAVRDAFKVRNGT